MSEVKVKRGNADVRLKSGPLGEVSAVVATLNVIDHDGDVATSGTFTPGEELVISAYNHSSMQVHGGALPVGKGTLHVDNTHAWISAEFFMMNATARESFEVIRAMGETQEWSYGYKVLDAEPGTFNGQRVNFLKKVQVFEASPVIKGAGIQTRTLSAKELAQQQFLRFLRSRARLSGVPVPTPGLAREAEAEARERAMQLRLRFERSRFDRSLAAN